jgi:flagellar biosynthetic protein FliQ
VNPGLDLQVLTLAREMVGLALLISGPILLVGLIVGLTVSVFQALTSVQEQTMSMVPKMLAVILTALFLLAPALGLLKDFALRVFQQMNVFGLS